MKHFLIHYDRPAGRLLSIREYDHEERAQAIADRDAQEFAKPDHVEVVLLSADCRADIERTHARYFKTPREMVESYFAAAST